MGRPITLFLHRPGAQRVVYPEHLLQRPSPPPSHPNRPVLPPTHGRSIGAGLLRLHGVGLPGSILWPNSRLGGTLPNGNAGRARGRYEAQDAVIAMHSARWRDRWNREQDVQTAWYGTDTRLPDAALRSGQRSEIASGAAVRPQRPGLAPSMYRGSKLFRHRPGRRLPEDCAVWRKLRRNNDVRELTRGDVQKMQEDRLPDAGAAPSSSRTYRPFGVH